eukprot:g32076.t1
MEEHEYFSFAFAPFGLTYKSKARVCIMFTLLMLQMAISAVFFGTQTTLARITIACICAAAVIAPTTMLQELFSRTGPLGPRDQFNFEIEKLKAKKLGKPEPKAPYRLPKRLKHIDYIVCAVIILGSAMLVLIYGMQFDLLRGEIDFKSVPDTENSGALLEVSYANYQVCRQKCESRMDCMGITFRKRDCRCFLVAAGATVPNSNFYSLAAVPLRDNTKAWFQTFIISAMLDTFVSKPLLLLGLLLLTLWSRKRVKGLDYGSLDMEQIISPKPRSSKRHFFPTAESKPSSPPKPRQKRVSAMLDSRGMGWAGDVLEQKGRTPEEEEAIEELGKTIEEALNAGMTIDDPALEQALATLNTLLQKQPAADKLKLPESVDSEMPGLVVRAQKGSIQGPGGLNVPAPRKRQKRISQRLDNLGLTWAGDVFEEQGRSPEEEAAIEELGKTIEEALDAGMSIDDPALQQAVETLNGLLDSNKKEEASRKKAQALVSPLDLSKSSSRLAKRVSTLELQNASKQTQKEEISDEEAIEVLGKAVEAAMEAGMDHRDPVFQNALSTLNTLIWKQASNAPAKGGQGSPGGPGESQRSSIISLPELDRQDSSSLLLSDLGVEDVEESGRRGSVKMHSVGMKLSQDTQRQQGTAAQSPPLARAGTMDVAGSRGQKQTFLQRQSLVLAKNVGQGYRDDDEEDEPSLLEGEPMQDVKAEEVFLERQLADSGGVGDAHQYDDHEDDDHDTGITHESPQSFVGSILPSRSPQGTTRLLSPAAAPSRPVQISPRVLEAKRQWERPGGGSTDRSAQEARRALARMSQMGPSPSAKSPRDKMVLGNVILETFVQKRKCKVRDRSDKYVCSPWTRDMSTSSSLSSSSPNQFHLQLSTPLAFRSTALSLLVFCFQFGSSTSVFDLCLQLLFPLHPYSSVSTSESLKFSFRFGFSSALVFSFSFLFSTSAFNFCFRTSANASDFFFLLLLIVLIFLSACTSASALASTFCFLFFFSFRSVSAFGFDPCICFASSSAAFCLSLRLLLQLRLNHVQLQLSTSIASRSTACFLLVSRFISHFLLLKFLLLHPLLQLLFLIGALIFGFHFVPPLLSLLHIPLQLRFSFLFCFDSALVFNFGHELARYSLRTPRLPLSTQKSVKDAQKFNNFRWSYLQLAEAADPKMLISLRDELSPITRAEMKILIHPGPAPAVGIDDPNVQLRANVVALPNDPTWEQLQDCYNPQQQQCTTMKPRQWEYDEQYLRQPTFSLPPVTQPKLERKIPEPKPLATTVKTDNENGHGAEDNCQSGDLVFGEATSATTQPVLPLPPNDEHPELQTELRRLAPRDILSGVSSSNIIESKRERRQTPTDHPTHHVKVAVEMNPTVPLQNQLAPLVDDIPSDVNDPAWCLYTRTLRVPERQIELFPQIVEARRKKVQGLYDTGCFVDAVKINDSDAGELFKSRLVIFGNHMTPFQQFSPYKVSSPVADKLYTARSVFCNASHRSRRPFDEFELLLRFAS